MTTKTNIQKHSPADVIAVADGRLVAVHEIPGQGDDAIVLFHPAPGAGAFDPDPAATAESGVTLIEIDRPGYGDSEPLASGTWATVAAAADDAAAVLDTRGYRSVGVAGWSAGGRIALALAARRPDLVRRVAVVATPAPHEQVPWMPDDIAAAVDALRGLPAEDVHAAMAQQLGGFAAVVAEQPAAGLEMLGISDADRAALAMPGAPDRLTALVSAAFAQATTGLVSDMAGYTLRPWGFQPADVAAETLLLYGSADPICGPRHGQWWQRQVPKAHLEVVPDAGHLVVMPVWSQVLSHLVPRH